MPAAEGGLFTIWRNLGVAVWRGRVDEASAEGARKMTRELMALHPGGFGLLNILDSRVQIPTAEARAKFSSTLRAASGHIRRAGVVVEGTGFHAAAVRAFSTGMNLLISAQFPFAMFETVGDAASWVAEGLPPVEGKPAQAQEIVALVRDLRAQRS